jgi:hypothetical protein
MKKCLFLFMMSGLLVFSCAHKNAGMKEISAGRLIKKDDILAKINEATLIYESGEIEAAIASLRMTVDNNPYQPAHDQCYELIVQWLLELKQQDHAKQIASYFLSHYPHSESAQRIVDLFDRVPVVTDVPMDQIHLEEQNAPEDASEDLTDQVIDFTNPTSMTEQDLAP